MAAAPRIAVGLVVAIVSVALAPSAALGEPEHGRTVRIDVGFRPGIAERERAALIEAFGGTAERSVPEIDLVVASVPRTVAGSVVAALASAPEVEYAEVDPIAVREGDLGDPRLGDQWGLARIGARTAWSRGSALREVVVAVVDTGVVAEHPDLAGRIVPGYDFVDGDGDPSDPARKFSHGTHVAGTIAATAGNGVGIAGVAPGARIMVVRSIGSDGEGYYSDIVSGIVFAVDHGARVINLSLAGNQPGSALERSLQFAAGEEVVTVCAAGNEGASEVGYPAAYDECFAVGASDTSDDVTWFSNSGQELDLVAPGVDILSTSVGTTYAYASGTSMSTAFVTGAVALLLSHGVAPAQVGGRLRVTARDVANAGFDAASGWGRLDLARAAAFGGSLHRPGVTRSGSSGSAWIVARDGDRVRCGTRSMPCRVRPGSVIRASARITGSDVGPYVVRVAVQRPVGTRWVTRRSIARHVLVGHATTFGIRIGRHPGLRRLRIRSRWGGRDRELMRPAILRVVARGVGGV